MIKTNHKLSNFFSKGQAITYHNGRLTGNTLVQCILPAPQMGVNDHSLFPSSRERFLQQDSIPQEKL